MALPDGGVKAGRLSLIAPVNGTAKRQHAGSLTSINIATGVALAGQFNRARTELWDETTITGGHLRRSGLVKEDIAIEPSSALTTRRRGCDIRATRTGGRQFARWKTIRGAKHTFTVLLRG